MAYYCYTRLHRAVINRPVAITPKAAGSLRKSAPVAVGLAQVHRLSTAGAVYRNLSPTSVDIRGLAVHSCQLPSTTVESRRQAPSVGDQRQTPPTAAERQCLTGNKRWPICALKYWFVGRLLFCWCKIIEHIFYESNSGIQSRSTLVGPLGSLPSTSSSVSSSSGSP